MRAALRAEYGIDLREVLGKRSMHVLDLADLVAWLPRGCVFWQSVGGPASLSAEVVELRKVGFWLRVLDYRERGSKGSKPKPDPDPEWAHEKRAESDSLNRKAAAYMRRHARG